MEVFVMCPFCRAVFDSVKEPHFMLRVDGHPRTAHVRCLEAIIARPPMPVAATVEKPNGHTQEAYA